MKEPAATVVPAISVERSANRLIICTGGSYLSASSTACPTSDGRAARAASAAGCRSSASTAAPMRLRVVSCPAMSSSMHSPISSSSVSGPPASCTSMSAEIRSPPGECRRDCSSPRR